MSLYEGNHCPVCHQVFADGDDIVVCPDCGTPAHRECWQREGRCANAARHGTDFVWQPEIAPEAAEQRTAVCPRCGGKNPLDARFCNSCGLPLSPSAAASNAAEAYRSRHEQADTSDGSGSAGRTVSFRELGPDDLIDGVKARDLATYVGPRGFWYLMQFFRMQGKHRISFNLSAFFFGPMYFFYRKMWKQGFLFTALDILLTSPYYLYLLKISGSALTAGIDGDFLLNALNFCSILSWAVMVLRSMFAVYWYKKETLHNIQAIYDAVPEGDERLDTLALRGGVSIAAVVIYMLALSAGGFFITNLMGPNMGAVLSALSL